MPETEKRQMKIKCPSCGVKLDVTDIEPFTVVPCPQCGFEVTIPMRFLSYVLMERLGKVGRMRLYRAQEESLDREVRLVTCEASGMVTWGRLEQYLENLRKAASLEIAGMAAVYACGRTENGVYAVSRMPSRHVQGNAQDVRLTWQEVRPMIVAFASVLQKLAEEGIVHGALGEQSFCLDDHGNPMLCGLGEGILLTGCVADDPYASPERRDGGGCTIAADLYSFGIWVCQLLTGSRAADGMDAHLLKETVPDVPSNVVDVLERMMSRSALRRPRGYGKLLSELCIAEQPLPGKAKVMRKRSEEGDARLLRSGKSAGYGFPLMAVLLLLLVGGAGGWLAWRMGWKPYETRCPSALRRKEAVAGEADETLASVGATAKQEASVVKPLPPKYRNIRPRPEDLCFDDDAVQDYLRLIPESWKLVEKERVARIIGIREYIFSLLRMPCCPEKSQGLRLRDGSFLKGYIAMGSEAGGLVVRPLDAEHQSLSVTSIRLEELDWSEIWRMLDFYGHERETMGQQGARTRGEIFEHYLSSALVCDWYGYREDAVSLAQKALVANPEGREIVEKFGLIGE